MELREVGRREPELVDPFQQHVGIENAQHRLLAERRRHRRHAQLDLAAVLVALDAAVLRPPFFGDVAAREQLHPRDDRLIDDARDDMDVVQHAVDAQSHERRVALRLEMNVRRALLEGVAEQMVERLDHRTRTGIELLGFAG